MFDDAMLNKLSDEEALAILASFGFTLSDWSSIAKLGGAKAILSSSLIATLMQKRRFLPRAFDDLRRKFDGFYSAQGFLMTPLESGPSRLFRCAKAPLAFFGCYQKNYIDASTVVAIVGSRNASAHGLQKAAQLSTVLSKHHISVASGGARGIDHAAHLYALQSQGTTIVVSGEACSFERCDRWQRIFPTLDEHGVVIFPYGPFLAQERFMFIERNRFVASIADALVVVEGKIGSGTLHTARFADALNVPIYCINPNADEPSAYAPHLLMTNGKARMLTNFEQFASTLVTKASKPLKTRKLVANDHMRNQRKIGSLPYLLQIINDHENSIGFDDLKVLTGWSYAELQRDLLEHELSGRILKRGSQFVLTGN